MCGEKRRNSRDPEVWQGSPPHVRGKDHRFFVNHRFLRITPACAGKRGEFLHPEMVCKDHPRMCGEKVTSTLLELGIKGSPPHVRGKVVRA